MPTLIMRLSALLYLVTACEFPRPPDVPDPAGDAAHDTPLDAPPDMSVTFSCAPNQFVACEASGARRCNATGDGTIVDDCGLAGCNSDAKRCNQCVPNADACGGAIELDHCGSDGLPAGSEMCALGCNATPSAHCAYIEPRYLPNACDAIATLPDFTVSNLVTFDTGIDTSCTGGAVHQDGGPEICVVRYGAIRVTPSGTLGVLGPRALALVADSVLRIEGTLDVSANGPRGGPGGSTVASGDGVSLNGGGGAGFATAGGAGGSATTDGGGGRGGGKATDPALVTVLLGGNIPTRIPRAPLTGGGGGAATLIACRGQIVISGVVASGGGGGQGGAPNPVVTGNFAGAGGGSGGNVVLQGLAITVNGQVYANGGGGGAGFVPGGPAGQPGSNGLPSATMAAPGGPSLAGEGAGGAGGRQGAIPGFGFHPSAANALPGGGGGSVGFFQTYTPSGVTPMLTPSSASPGFSPNLTIGTR